MIFTGDRTTSVVEFVTSSDEKLEHRKRLRDFQCGQRVRSIAHPDWRWSSSTLETPQTENSCSSADDI